MNMRWFWRAQCTAVIDGDTLEMEIDTGFHTVRTERVRLVGVNAPETRGPSRNAGLAAKAWTTKWVNDAQRETKWPFMVETFKTDSFGRYLARVWVEKEMDTDSSSDLSDQLIKSGHAVPFMEGKV